MLAHKSKPLSLGRRIAIFLAILGPGIITGSVDNDAGGITTYSVAGAVYGYNMLWTLIPAFIVLSCIFLVHTIHHCLTFVVCSAHGASIVRGGQRHHSCSAMTGVRYREWLMVRHVCLGSSIACP